MKKVLLLLTVITILIAGCKKDEPAGIQEDIILVSEVTVISVNSAVINFNIERAGCNSNEIEIGVCYAEKSLPTIADLKHFTMAMCSYKGGKKISQLKSDTKYYVRGYIKKETGVVYGNEVSFTTLP